jgi:hypothetical protein
MQSAEEALLLRREVLNARKPIFDAPHMQEAPFQIHLAPLQRYDLGYPEPMTESQNDQCGIAVAMPAYAARCFDQACDFVFGEVLPRPPLGIRQSTRRNFAIRGYIL